MRAELGDEVEIVVTEAFDVDQALLLIFREDRINPTIAAPIKRFPST